MKLFLIRHARTEAHFNMVSQSHDSPIFLDDKAKETIEKIKPQVANTDYRFSSPYTRAIETSNQIFGENNYEILDYIYEYKTASELVGQNWEISRNYWEIEHNEDRRNIHWTPPGGESFLSIVERVNALYDYMLELKANGAESVAIVGHGIFFRHFLLRAAGIPWTEYPGLIFDVLRKLDWENLKVVELEI